MIEAVSGKADVPVLSGGAKLLLTEVGLLYRLDNRPVLANGTVLEPPPQKPERLHGRSGNPDRRKQVAPAAPHNDVAEHPIPAQFHRKRLKEKCSDDEPESTAGRRNGA
jgi:hypothetical protein